MSEILFFDVEDRMVLEKKESSKTYLIFLIFFLSRAIYSEPCSCAGLFESAQRERVAWGRLELGKPAEIHGHRDVQCAALCIQGDIEGEGVGCFIIEDGGENNKTQ